MTLALSSLAACGGSDSTAVDTTTPTGISPVTQANVALVGGQATTVTVKVVNGSGSPLSGVAVAFSATANGFVGSPSTRTAADGTASTQWTVAKVVGQQVLTASVTGTNLAIAFSAAVTIPLSGTWVGNVGTQVLTMTLVESSGNVTGSGTLTGTPSGTRAQVITGSLLNSTFTATLTSGGATPFNITATVNGATMIGTLTGSGFTGDAITLTKQ
jgi:hypothetical protein